MNKQNDLQSNLIGTDNTGDLILDQMYTDSSELYTYNTKTAKDVTNIFQYDTSMLKPYIDSTEQCTQIRKLARDIIICELKKLGFVAIDSTRDLEKTLIVYASNTCESRIHELYSVNNLKDDIREKLLTACDTHFKTQGYILLLDITISESENGIFVYL